MSKTLIGQTLLERFRVDVFIASGGMGVVYRVRDLKRNVPLAMKILHTELAEDPSIFKRFKREANALKKLAHPNIVPFYGLYQTADFAFLLERYVDGQSLKEILRKQKGKPLPIEVVLSILKALSAALGYAHANGVVHCDVKPGNVMIDQGGNIYLTDFGIARHSDSSTTTLASVGTAAYMAPEQIKGELVTPATDIYSLSILLFEMLTGQKPFRGDEKSTENAGATAGDRIRYAHLSLLPPDPQMINQALNQDITHVIFKSLRKETRQRYQSTQAWFLAVCDALGFQSELIPDRVTLPDIQDMFSEETTDMGTATSSDHKRQVISAILVLFGVLALAIFFLSISGWINLPSINLSIFSRDTDQLSQTLTISLDTATNELILVTSTMPAVTYTPKTATVTPLRKYTPIVSISSTPFYSKISFTAAQNLMCRRGPDSYYEHAYDVYKGETYDVMAKWSNGWILLKIVNPRVETRTRCCWVSNIGALEGNLDDIPLIDDWVEDMRITCDIQ